MKPKLALLCTLIVGVVIVVTWCALSSNTVVPVIGSGINGFVKDKDGAPIVGAVVRAINRANGEGADQVKSGKAGYFVIPLSEGKYVLSVQKEDFNDSIIEAVDVVGSQSTQQDVVLTAKGQAGLPPGLNNPAGYVFAQGAQTEEEARAIIAVHGRLDNTQIVDTFETNLTGEFESRYRSGQAVVPYIIVYENEPVWGFKLSDGTTDFVQKKCGNFAEEKETVVVVVAATPVPTPIPAIVWTATPEPTPKPVPATFVPTPTCIPQVIATPTPIPTSVPSSTPTSMPTAMPTATFTPVPTNTKIPPTSTLIPTSTPTSTPQPTATPTATRIPPTLEGRAWAEPDSGYAPLLGVDVFIEITGGTAIGPIDYYVDCTLDGSWDIQIPGANNTSQHIVDICSFPTPGEYHILTLAKREGIPLSSLLTIEVFAP